MKIYLETEESNLKGDAATNLRDRLLIHVLFQSVAQQALLISSLSKLSRIV